MKQEKGAWTIINRGDIHKRLCKKHCRDPKGLCTKIFYKEPTDSIDGYRWGDDWGCDVRTSAMFQNICAMDGLAPRIYAQEIIEYKGEKCLARLVDYVDGEKRFSQENIDRILQINELFGNVHVDFPDFEDNMIDGKLIDFQVFGLDEEIYRLFVNKLCEENFWGFFYQSIPGVTAHRDYQDRIKDFNLDEIDFIGKTVIDLGCSNGMFCHYVETRGGRAVGVDLPVYEAPVRHLANLHQLFNIDFIPLDLRSEKPIGFYDYAFFFSMAAHVGIPDWLKDIAQEVLFEQSGGELPQETIDKSKKLIDTMTLLRQGKSMDRDRDFYHLCQKG